MHQSDYSQKQYEEDFREKEKREKALVSALDTRKFEIELYWKRAAYFWTFIGAAFAGFVAVQASSPANKQDLAVVLSSLGFVFSVGWFCVNRGSKHWQENWEKHVDLLEDGISGPLYKVVFARIKPNGWSEIVRNAATGPSKLSVSKINQLMSLYVSVLWVALVWHSLPEFRLEAPINWFYCVIISLSLFASVTFFWLGRASPNDRPFHATIRTAEFEDG